MSYLRLFPILGLALAGLLASACDGPTEHSPAARPQELRRGITPNCLPGCVDEYDPNPAAPGVWLTSGVSDETCFNPYGGTDTDNDRLINRCEDELARAFAPQLYYYQFDNVGREPHYAAERIGTTARVKIAYLLSYYRDEGSAVSLCSLPGAPASCHGHNGDSEIIVLIVYYDWITQHWILEEADYSQHGNMVRLTRGTNAYPLSLYYPYHAGAAPRAWVSRGKHANYPSLNACNNGGTLKIDTCNGNSVGATVVSTFNLNIGSARVHTANQDCMVSGNPSYQYYGSGKKECYWTFGMEFRGWIPYTVGGLASSDYGTILYNQGFVYRL